ncbi:MAG: hypothetical protein KKD28_07365, partial [Chloroflexi bacterium]|nr:hypothetical protein [Chloroflexota bacterium]
AYSIHALYAIFLHQGLDAKRIGPDRDRPFDPETGEGYIVVNDYVVVDVTQAKCLRRDVVDRFDGRIPNGRYKSILLNFGSTQPEYYPPEDGNIADFLEERDDDEYDDGDGDYYYEMPSEE